MAKQDSDSSSSYETASEDDMETSLPDTDSEIDNIVKSNLKSFELSFLKRKERSSKKRIFDSYLHNKNHFSQEKRSFFINKTSDPVPANFTPWWDSLNLKQKSSEEPSTSDVHNDKLLFDNWFDKSVPNADSSNWLSGPRSQPLLEESSKVEDIEVPSIYGQVSKPKGRKALKRERREQRNKTTGKKWYDMKQPDVDSNTKMDMELLQMRRALDPKRFYKQNDRKGLPKYFQLGTVVDEGTDFFSSRLTKKQRKQTLVEELMADANVRKYNKKKYEELQQKQRTKKFTKKGKA